MARTLKDLIDTVIIDLDAEEERLTITNNIKSFINRAYKELAKRELLEKSIDVTAIDGLIDKPSDYYKTSNVVFENNLLEHSEESGYITVSESGDMKLYYFYIPDNLGDSDEPKTNPSNDEFIIDLAKYLYFRQIKQYSKAEVYKRDYETMNIKQTKKTLQIITVR